VDVGTIPGHPFWDGIVELGRHWIPSLVADSAVPLCVHRLAGRRPLVPSPHASRLTHYISRFTFYVLLVWYVISAATIFPHNLAYFNELAGGPEGGYNWLVDSNLDWDRTSKS